MVPLIIREIRRLLASLLFDDGDGDAGFHRALRHVAVTGGARLVSYAFFPAVSDSGVGATGLS